ncbi:uncharacterized protein [Montipora foliosa]|uniref:uncharacterized protein n=1 Tax=Montipora foliosa TaxID=591990 RepID=UPI0035F14B1F
MKPLTLSHYQDDDCSTQRKPPVMCPCEQSCNCFPKKTSTFLQSSELISKSCAYLSSICSIILLVVLITWKLACEESYSKSVDGEAYAGGIQGYTGSHDVSTGKPGTTGGNTI